MSSKVLHWYKLSCESRGAPMENTHVLQHRTNKIRLNLNMYSGQLRANIPVMRSLLAFEAKYKKKYFLRTVEPLFNHHPTPKEIYALSDRDIVIAIKAVESTEDYQKDVANGRKHTQLLKCGHCDKQEGFMGEFRVCVRCKEEVYCGKACQVSKLLLDSVRYLIACVILSLTFFSWMRFELLQKAGWKQHKKVCGRKDKSLA